MPIVKWRRESNKEYSARVAASKAPGSNKKTVPLKMDAESVATRLLYYALATLHVDVTDADIFLALRKKKASPTRVASIRRKMQRILKNQVATLQKLLNQAGVSTTAFEQRIEARNHELQLGKQNGGKKKKDAT